MNYYHQNLHFVVNNEIKTILLVEGESDALFISKYIDFLFGVKNFIDVIGIEFSAIGGSDKKKISLKLQSIYTDLRNKQVGKLGIIVDIDTYTIQDRVDFLNDAIQDAALKKRFEVNKFTIDESTVIIKPNNEKEIEFSYFLIKDANNEGNLENLLQNIVTSKPVAANCLENWKNCAIENGVKIKQSDFLKMWRDVYVRYDYCSNKELAKHAVDNCTFEKSLDNMLIDEKPQAWDFKHKTLDPLKQYLTQFQ